MDRKDLLECCHVVLDFLNDVDIPVNFNDCKTMKEMDRVLSKNDFNSSVHGTNMMCFFRWLTHEYGFESPDQYSTHKAFFSDNNTESRAKLLLRVVIRDLNIDDLLCRN
jgi:hypothetical protein